MSDTVKIHKAQAIAGYPLALRMDVTDLYGQPITQAGISEISATIHEKGDETNATTFSFDLSTIHDEYQSWEKNATGYNVLAILSGSYIPTANKVYKLTISFIDADTEQYEYPAVWLIYTD